MKEKSRTAIFFHNLIGSEKNIFIGQKERKEKYEENKNIIFISSSLSSFFPTTNHIIFNLVFGFNIKLLEDERRYDL